MPLASIVRTQIETALSQKIPSALTPAPKMIRPVAETGIESLDEVLKGGLPVGAISELVGPESSGRTSTAFSFLARVTEIGKVCAWIDVSDSLDPASASAAGVDLSHLLWVRCGVGPKAVPQPKSHFALPNKYLVPLPVTKRLHGSGCGSHPRSETKGLSQAVSGLLQPEAPAPHRAESQRRVRQRQDYFESAYQQGSMQTPRVSPPSKPWSRIEQGLRTTDLLLQGGGFSAIGVRHGQSQP